MEMKGVAILGSTGSIGRLALEVIVANPGRFRVVALAAGRNVKLLAEQVQKFRPRYVAVYSPDEVSQLKGLCPSSEAEIGSGQEGLIAAAALPENDVVLNALVGSAGLLASLEVIRSGKPLALANKESLVVGGSLFEEEMKKSGAAVLPVDSEHSAIWQCLRAGRVEEVRRLWLTASGGPFRERDKNSFKSITVEEALSHPTWKMGPKVTIDSATMMNKGLELIEAVHLFSMPPDKVKIIIHPQSIVHSMVEFVDSTIIAQLSYPDMRLPIAHALFWPDRLPSDNGRIDLAKAETLTFSEPDEDKFPALRLARSAVEKGGTAPAALNAANEIAVEQFLAGRISFAAITELIEEILVKHVVNPCPVLADILECDRLTRDLTRQMIESRV